MSTPEKKIKNILIYLVPSAISNILPFLTLPIITRILSLQDFGIAALAMTSVAIIFAILACNVDTGAQMYYFKYRKDSFELRSLINTDLAFLLAVVLFSIPLIFVFSGFFSKLVMGSSQYAHAIFIAYVGVALTGLVNFYLKLYRNMEDAKKFSLFTVSQVLLNAVFSLVFIAIFKMGFMGLIYANLLSSSLLFLTLFFIFLRKFPWLLQFKKLTESFLYGIQFTPSMFLSSIYQFFDKYLLRTLISFTSTGIFSLAQNFSNKLFVFMTAVQATFDPLFMKAIFDKGEEGAISIGRNFTVFTYISLASILFMVLFCEELIRLLAPPSYYPTINIISIILCGTSTQTFSKVTGAPLAYKNKAFIIFPIGIIGVMVTIVANIILIPRFQAVGAAIASFITLLVINLIVLVWSQKLYKIHFQTRILLFLYGNIFLSTITMIYLRHIGAGIAAKYAFKLIFMLFFVFTGIEAKILTKKNIKIIMNMARFRKTIPHPMVMEG